MEGRDFRQKFNKALLIANRLEAAFAVIDGSTLFKNCVASPGSVDGKIMVEDDGGQMSDFTTVTWQIGLGETLCYR